MRRMATPEEILELQTNVKSLNAAIASGARSVTLGGQTVTYNTTDSLIKARNDQQALLNAALATKRRPRQMYLYQAGRGLD